LLTGIPEADINPADSNGTEVDMVPLNIRYAPFNRFHIFISEADIEDQDVSIGMFIFNVWKNPAR
jgi:hypothetical protein